MHKIAIWLNDPIAPGSPAVVLISIKHLHKKYDDVVALRDCNLEVVRGEIFGLLGPNGAGKSTLIRLLLGFLRPTSGSAQIAGLDCSRNAVKIHQRTSYLPGDVRLFRRMAAREYLKFVSELRHRASLTQALELADELQLELNRRVAFMSTGMRQKLALVGALAAGAELIILDEPTANLDPNVRAVVASKIQQLARQGTTILFSSHVLPEVEQICDRVAIMKEGEIALVQEMSHLHTQHRISATLPRELFVINESLRHQIRVLHETDHQVVFETPAALASLLGWLANLPLQEVTIARVGLRSVYDRIHPNGPPLESNLVSAEGADRDPGPEVEAT